VELERQSERMDPYIAAPGELREDVLDSLDGRENQEATQGDREHGAPMPAVELPRPAQKLAHGPLMSQGRDVHRAPAGEHRRHEDEEKQGYAETDCPNRGLGLEVDEPRDPRDR